MRLSRFDHIQIAASRLLSAIVYGDSRWMLSSLAYSREASLLQWVLDWTFWLLIGEVNHCQNSFEWESDYYRD